MSSISQLPKLYLLRGYYAPVPNTPKAKGNIKLVGQVEPLPEQLLFLGHSVVVKASHIK